jgi:hypothetical protein
MRKTTGSTTLPRLAKLHFPTREKFDPKPPKIASFSPRQSPEVNSREKYPLFSARLTREKSPFQPQNWIADLSNRNSRPQSARANSSTIGRQPPFDGQPATDSRSAKNALSSPLPQKTPGKSDQLIHTFYTSILLHKNLF